MAVRDRTEQTNRDDVLSNGAFYLLAILVPIQIGLISAEMLYNPGPEATTLVSLWLLTHIAMPLLGYIDLRRARKTDHWQLHWRGALWLIGLAIPVVSTSVAVTYVFRRRELVTHDSSWDRWLYVICGAIAVMYLSLLLFSFFEDPSVEESTPLQQALLTPFITFMSLPGLATYFDLMYLQRSWGRKLSFYHWLWIPGMLAWFLQIPIFVLYVIWRRQGLNIQESVEAAESALDEVNQRLDSGTEALNDGLYERALTSYGRAEDALDRARDAIRSADSQPDERPQRIADLTARLEDAETSLDVRRNHAEASQLIERGQEELDRGNPGSAIDSFESAVERCEEALDVSSAEEIDETVRETFGRARAGCEKARENFVATEIDPLADRIESAYSVGVDALDAGDYETAVDQFEAVREDLDTFESQVQSYELDRSPSIDPADIEAKLTAAERQRVIAEEVDPLVDRIESAYPNGIEALEDGRYDAAIEQLDELESEIDRLSSLIDEYDLDRELPVTHDEVTEAVQRAKRDRKRSRIESQLERASEHRHAGEAAMDDGEYDRAVDTFETAREHLNTAASLIDGADAVEFDKEWDLEEQRHSLTGLYGAAVRQQKEQRYREPLERGDEHRETAIEAADENRYGDGIEALESAREAYEEAAQVAESSEVGDVDAIQDRLSEVTELYADYWVKELSRRVTEARVDPDEDERDRCLAAASTLEDIVADLDRVDIDRGRDLEIIREEAHRERIKARLLAERERARRAVEAFEESDYATARDNFEATADAVADLRSEAEEVEVTEYDDAIDRLASTCTQNADAARRGVLGIADKPTVTTVDLSLEEREPTAQRQKNASGSRGMQNAGTVDADSGVNTALKDQLPAHEQLGHIGSGGNADVYEVRLDTGEHAALKVPRWQGTLSAAIVEEFASEAETWNKLDEHEHIVSLLAWGKQPYPWMLLEFLPASLADRMDNLSTDQALDILIDVADALEFAHGRGVVHLDIKPQNVLLTDADVPMVGDWGLSQVVLEHTQTQMGLTPPYSAPEQLTDRYGEIDRRTDVYQLSVLAYRMLTGRLPFDADRPADLQRQILDEDPDLPSAIKPALDPAVDDVLLRGLFRSPADRYEAVVLLRNELRSLVK